MTTLAEYEFRRDLLKAELLDINPEARPDWHMRVFQLLIDNEKALRAHSEELLKGLS